MSTATTQIRLPAEQRQAEMVRAVVELAAVQEPASITTTNIAEAVGLSQGAVFRHFPNKQAVWGAVAEWLELTLLGTVRDAIEPGHPPLENLAAIFHVHIGFVQQHPGVPRFIFHELQQPSDSAVKQKVSSMLRTYGDILAGQLRQAKSAGDTDPLLNEQSAALLFIGSLQGLVMQSMLAGPAVLQNSAADVLALYLRALGRS